MDFFDKLDKSNGGYIFLSHSHADIDKVRKLRNMLEESGFEPLCFYLKCLNDNSEIEDLIKREIDAREWFVFANSENARKSKWVTLEREYINKTNRKKILVVNIDDEEEITNTVDKIKHNLRVFLSYSHRDRVLVEKIKGKLEQKDYLVFWDENLPAGDDWSEKTETNIQEACQDGCVIAVITENSIRSTNMLKEIMFAFDQGGNILTIIVGNAALSDAQNYFLALTPHVFMSESPTDEEIANVVDAVGNIIVDK